MSLRDRLQACLTTAMKARDTRAVAAYRSALAAIANAEALPVDQAPGAGAIELSAVGVGVNDAPRRALTAADMRVIVESEIAERRAMLPLVDDARSADLRTEIDALVEVLAA